MAPDFRVRVEGFNGPLLHLAEQRFQSKLGSRKREVKARTREGTRSVVEDADQLGERVENRTGLPGEYDFVLNWTYKTEAAQKPEE